MVGAEETVFVRVGSRRAGDKLKRIMGVDSLDWHYNLWDGNSFALIPASRLDEARAITGITKARTKRRLSRCHTW